MLEHEVVRRRGWMTRERFLDYVGAANLIPGPNSTELAIHIGYARAGWPGLVVAGVCFILPAALIVSGIAWAYTRWGTVPSARAVMGGIGPVVIAIVAYAVWTFARTALRTRSLAIIGAACVVAAAAGVHELAVLGLAAVTSVLWSRRALHAAPALAWWMPDHEPGAATLATTAAGVGAVVSAAAAGPWSLFGAFLKIGATLFGSGYVLVAYLRADFVTRLGWLTERQLLDAIAVGQVTPGPVFTTATFVGWTLAGPAGAAAATIGIFLPAFVFVALSGPLVPRIRRSPTAGAALDGVNAASVALIAVAAVPLGRTALAGPIGIGIAAVALTLLAGSRVNATWLVAGGAAAGLLMG